METLFESEFPATTAALAELRGIVRERALAAGCGRDAADAMVLAANEAAMNIVQHGYGFAEGQYFRLRIARDADMLYLQLLDNAKAVALDDLRPRELDDIRPGGLGVRFMRELMDSVDYLPPPPGFSNLLQLGKRIE